MAAQSWFRKLFAPRRRATRAARTSFFRSSLEQLEQARCSRHVLLRHETRSTTSIPGSFRGALTQANATPGDDFIDTLENVGEPNGIVIPHAIDLVLL